jgi:hypothetical protein
VGVGWARQEFEALGVPFRERGRLTDSHLDEIKAAWDTHAGDYRSGRIPIWVGGNSDAAVRRAIRLGETWHPLRFTLPWLREVLAANEVAAFAPRIILRLTDEPPAGRRAGEGTIEQIIDDLTELERLGAETVLLDTFTGDPQETCHPEVAWQALATVAAHCRKS